MYIILPTHQLGEELNIELSILIKKELGERINDFPEIFSKQQCCSIIEGIVEEYVLNPLHWTESYDYVKRRIESSLSPLIANGYDCNKFFKVIYLNILEKYHNFLVKILENKIDLKSEESYWRVWYTFHLNNDLVLESGTDYRILDWEQKVMDGIIEAPKGLKR